MRVPALYLALPILLLALAVVGPQSLRAQDAAVVGQLVDLRGEVTLVRGAAREPLAVGASLRRGDRIATGTGGRAKVELHDGSTLTLGPESAIEISDYLAEGGRGLRARLTLLIGIVRTALSGGDWRDGFEVETRAAVASVRSTEWVTEAGAEGTAVFVVEGEVAVVAPEAGVGVLLGPGFGTDVAPGERPAPPKRWGAARVEDVLARTSLP